MNIFVQQFLDLFDLDKMGYQPFILIEYYPGNSLTQSTSIYMTLGQFHGPVHVNFQGDNVSLLSHFRPPMVHYKSGGTFNKSMQVDTERKAASFHMSDISECKLIDLGHVMTTGNRACRLIAGRDEIQEFLKLIYQSPAKQKVSGYRWDTFKEMYELAFPKTHMFMHNFQYKQLAKADG